MGPKRYFKIPQLFTDACSVPTLNWVLGLKQYDMALGLEGLTVRQGSQTREKIMTMWCLTRGTGGSSAASSGWRTPVGTANTRGCALGAPGGRERVNIRRQLSWWVVGPRRGSGCWGRNHPGPPVPRAGPRTCSVLVTSLLSESMNKWLNEAG